MTGKTTAGEHEGLAPWHTAIPRSVEGWAFFFDIDGTLIDIAARPDDVVVPAALPPTLARVWKQAGGALALLTGRAIPMVDQVFAPYHLPVGAIHGAIIRHVSEVDDGAPSVPSSSLREVRKILEPFVAAHPAALLEDKGAAVAVHFRLDPLLEAKAEEVVRAAVAAFGEELTVQPGKMVFEVKPVGSDKGTALNAFMQSPPFAGRRPVAIGDDVTDEAMFRAAVAAGGVALGVGVPRQETVAITAFAGPEDVRNWLGTLLS